MYRVALCEDEAQCALELETICRAILDKLAVEYELALYDGSEAFLRAFSGAQKRFDLMLLDIVMPAPNGMDLARLIRREDGHGAILFVTSNPDYALLGYDVQALHYLLKPVDRAVLERLITADYKNRFQNSFYLFESGAQKVRVPVNDIIALETVGRKVTVTLHSGTVTYAGKLTELLGQLPGEQFVRCHQAFALNIRNTRELSHNEAIAVTGKHIPISRTFLKDVQRAFVKHLRNL